MNELVTVNHNIAVTTSLLVAEMFHKRHDSVIRDIKNLDCSKEFNLHNFVETSYVDTWNRKQPYYLITKDGFTFLVMGYRGKQAAEFKEKYIAAFNKMENYLKEKTSTEWLEQRRTGILTRNNETDVIKQLVEYAREQGSGHADMLYLTYTKLANKASGIACRDDATIGQLNVLAIIENTIISMLHKGMDEGLNYKEIYKQTRERVERVRDIAFLDTFNERLLAAQSK